MEKREVGFPAKEGKKEKREKGNRRNGTNGKHMCEIKIIMDDDVEIHEQSLNWPKSVSLMTGGVKEDCVFQFLLQNPLLKQS